MTKLYLIRHIQAEGNLFRLMQGYWDGVPTALGLRQARHLAARFAAVPLDAVYASDLVRARMIYATIHQKAVRAAARSTRKPLCEESPGSIGQG